MDKFPSFQDKADKFKHIQGVVHYILLMKNIVNVINAYARINPSNALIKKPYTVIADSIIKIKILRFFIIKFF